MLRMMESMRGYIGKVEGWYELSLSSWWLSMSILNCVPEEALVLLESLLFGFAVHPPASFRCLDSLYFAKKLSPRRQWVMLLEGHVVDGSER